MTAVETVAIQKTIYQTVRADHRLDHVTVLGPAAHAPRAGQPQRPRLPRPGPSRIKPFQTPRRAQLSPPPPTVTTKLSSRLGLRVRRFGDNYPVQLTETGWTTGGTTGIPRTPKPSRHLRCPSGAHHGRPRFPPCATKRSTTPRWAEETGSASGPAPRTSDTSKWRAKPEVSSVGNLLRALRDPGPAYVPPAIQLSIVGNVHPAVTCRRDGAATAWLWVNADSPVQATRHRQPGHPHLPGLQAPHPGPATPRRLRPS